ncbi:hypothetical protein LWI28_002105 [Acer negundo]|uniref:HMA domain-containing protein n=1 Tax=Acer negundo TaxID=4023 RepID=A0AAD5I8Y7_ACENE|nr:hypothetical protein LWI28_002105 [Acer negundo]KAK4836495.1 hypothetical protein QYF36_023874 [Acer negundo]
MGEETKQQKQAKASEAAQPVDQEKKEEKPEEAAVEEPKPPSPFVLFVDLHCVGCAKKIEKSIMRIKGVERVAINMGENQVTVMGIVEPQAVCNKIMKKTKRRAKVLSPLPPAEGEPIPQVVTSQVSGPTTVELNVNMHCEACAEQLKRKILKMRGVQTAETELSSEKVTVTGTMDANKLVEYVYRRTKKLAKIVPQPEPEPEKPAEEKKEEGDKPAEEAKPPEEKKEESSEKKEEDQKPPEQQEGDDQKKEEASLKKVEDDDQQNMNVNVISSNLEEEHMKRMMHYYQQYQPLYVIERTPPPQLFSDENPNACCIS